MSQSVHAGGYSFVHPGANSNSLANWWVKPDFWTWYGYDWSLTWSVANDYRNFLEATYPGGWNEGTAPGSSTNYYTPSTVNTGDVLFYNWGGGEGISHSAIQVGWGADPKSGWYGNCRRAYHQSTVCVLVAPPIQFAVGNDHRLLRTHRRTITRWKP